MTTTLRLVYYFSAASGQFCALHRQTLRVGFPVTFFRILYPGSGQKHLKSLSGNCLAVLPGRPSDGIYPFGTPIAY